MSRPFAFSAAIAARTAHVEYQSPEAKLPPPALKHLDVLLAMADDPDAGVRRELILAFRNLPTEKVGGALRKLAASWDGQDRWYLEALGLALEKRESPYLAKLFDGTLYGEFDLKQAGDESKLALPPYFPVDRNEAYIETGTPDLPATAVSKSLGLAWRLHRREVLPVLERMVPSLRAPELQQAADDILERIERARNSRAGGWIRDQDHRPVHRRELFSLLARRSRATGTGPANAHVLKTIELALADPETRAAGDRAGGGHPRRAVPDDARGFRPGCAAPEEVRVAAVEAIGSFPSRPTACSSSSSHRYAVSRAPTRSPRRRYGPWPSTPAPGTH